MNHSTSRDGRTQSPSPADLDQIAKLLQGLRYGSVNIIVQDGVIVQIDRTEKRRLRSQLSASDRACRQEDSSTT